MARIVILHPGAPDPFRSAKGYLERSGHRVDLLREAPGWERSLGGPPPDVLLAPAISALASPHQIASFMEAHHPTHEYALVGLCGTSPDAIPGVPKGEPWRDWAQPYDAFLPVQAGLWQVVLAVEQLLYRRVSRRD